MKRFYLQRNQDASGVSGTGKVAEGCQFNTKWCALVWTTNKSSMSFYPDVETLIAIHGHGGMTELVWVDSEHEKAPEPQHESLIQFAKKFMKSYK